MWLDAVKSTEQNQGAVQCIQVGQLWLLWQVHVWILQQCVGTHASPLLFVQLGPQPVDNYEDPATAHQLERPEDGFICTDHPP